MNPSTIKPPPARNRSAINPHWRSATNPQWRSVIEPQLIRNRSVINPQAIHNQSATNPQPIRNQSAIQINRSAIDPQSIRDQSSIDPQSILSFRQLPSAQALQRWPKRPILSHVFAMSASTHEAARRVRQCLRFQIITNKSKHTGKPLGETWMKEKWPELLEAHFVSKEPGEAACLQDCLTMLSTGKAKVTVSTRGPRAKMDLGEEEQQGAEDRDLGDGEKLAIKMWYEKKDKQLTQERGDHYVTERNLSALARAYHEENKEAHAKTHQDVNRIQQTLENGFAALGVSQAALTGSAAQGQETDEKALAQQKATQKAGMARTDAELKARKEGVGTVVRCAPNYDVRYLVVGVQFDHLFVKKHQDQPIFIRRDGDSSAPAGSAVVPAATEEETAVAAAPAAANVNKKPKPVQRKDVVEEDAKKKRDGARLNDVQVEIVSTYTVGTEKTRVCFRTRQSGDSGQEPSVGIYECLYEELQDAEGTRAKRKASPATRQASPATKLPRRTIPTSWAADVMNMDELAEIEVPVEEIGTTLLPTMEKCGVALVTGCLSQDEVAELQNCFQRDVGSLLMAHAPQLPGDGACKGLCASGKPCSVTQSSVGFQHKYALPLKHGGLYCARHAPFSVGMDAAGGKAFLLKSCPTEIAELLGAGGTFGYGMSARGLPGGTFSWACRTHANVRKSFEVLHGSEDLVTSLDNPFFSPVEEKSATRNKLWPHVDVNMNIPGATTCFQGVLYVWPSEREDTSTTVVLPHSHAAHFAATMEGATLKQGHFVQVKNMQDKVKRDEVLSAWIENSRRVPAPAGSLLLWNSRTLHQGWRGGPRLAQAVCWERKEYRNEAALERKLLLAALAEPSTHWASLGKPHPCRRGPSQVAIVEASGERMGLRGALLSAALREGTFSSASEVWERFGAWKAPLSAEQRKELTSALKYTHLL